MVACKYCKYYKYYLNYSHHVCTHNAKIIAEFNPIDGETFHKRYSSCKTKNANYDCKDFTQVGMLRLLWIKLKDVMGLEG